MKLKFIRNRTTIKVTNSTHESVTFDPKEMLGIVDLRSVVYYKIKQGVLQQNLNCMYYFESVNTVCDQFINTLRKEEEEPCNTDKYPWLDDSDERKKHDGQGNTRQIHRFGRLMPNQMGKAKVEKPHI